MKRKSGQNKTNRKAVKFLTLTTAIKKRKNLSLEEVVERLDELKDAIFESTAETKGGSKIKQLLENEATTDFVTLLQARTIIVRLKQILSDKTLDGISIDVGATKGISN